MLSPARLLGSRRPWSPRVRSHTVENVDSAGTVVVRWIQVLGQEVVVCEQRLEVVHDLGDRLGPLGAEFVRVRCPARIAWWRSSAKIRLVVGRADFGSAARTLATLCTQRTTTGRAPRAAIPVFQCNRCQLVSEANMRVRPTWMSSRGHVFDTESQASVSGRTSVEPLIVTAGPWELALTSASQ